MKQFKRLATALLLGAMVLTMFTACSFTSIKEKNVLEAIKIVSGNKEIEIDEELQADAEYVASKFATGENLESNKYAGRAYARVDSDDTKFWDIVARANCFSTWAGPLWYNPWASGVNVSLLLPYSSDLTRMTQVLYQNNSDTCLNGMEKVGIAIVNVKGDDYVVIVAGM